MPNAEERGDVWPLTFGAADRRDYLPEMSRLSAWLRVASQPAVLKRSATVCVLVGTILVAINHGPAIVAGAVNATVLAQILLTYLVPFVVSTATSVAALKPSGEETTTER